MCDGSPDTDVIFRTKTQERAVTDKPAHAANQPARQAGHRVARGPRSGSGVPVDPAGQADQLAAHGAKITDMAVRNSARLLESP
jgi:hypothetical protein